MKTFKKKFKLNLYVIIKEDGTTESYYCAEPPEGAEGTVMKVKNKYILVEREYDVDCYLNEKHLKEKNNERVNNI